MSKNYISGIFDTFALLKFLPSNKFLSSGELRKKFADIKSGTLNAKLRKLHRDGLIDFREKVLERAGDDKREYKLNTNGIKARNDLVSKIIHILEPEINTLINQKIKEKGKENL
ncbi:MAG: hypothetical protein ACFFDF_17520 [Candidatus Odinarchaeota archaeon]